MSLELIRRTYGVPAHKGGRVRYTGSGGEPRFGTITGADGPYLKIRLDGNRHAFPHHPTWELEYLPCDSDRNPEGAETGTGSVGEADRARAEGIARKDLEP